VQSGAALRAALNSAKSGDVPNEHFEQQVGFCGEALAAKTDVRSIIDANPDLKAALRTSANGETPQSTVHDEQSLQEAIGQFNMPNLAYAEARQTFGGPRTQIKQHKLEQIILQRQPLVDCVAGSKTSMDQVVSLAQKVYNQLYKGASLQKLLTRTHERYAATLKAMFAATALGTSEATGRTTRPQTISSALGLTGALTETSGKALHPSSDAIVGQLKILGGAGKTIGGVGSGMSGYFKLSSGIQELDHGDATRGINSATQGAAGLMSGGAAVVEGVAAGLGAINMTGSANSTAALAGPVGWIAAGIGLEAALAIRAIEDAQHEGRNNHFLYQIAPVLHQYGFSLPAAHL
jgi:hypothetical protein